MRTVDVNHVCDSQPWCFCVGGETEWDECDCQYGGFARCLACGAPMRKIDVSTGENVLEHCEARWERVDYSDEAFDMGTGPGCSPFDLTRRTK